MRLGIPKFAINVATLVEAKEIPLRLHTNARAFRHMERLHRTPSVSFFLQRLVDHPCSQMRRLTATFNNIIGPPSAPPQSSLPSLQIHTEIAGARKTQTLPDGVLRSIVFTHLEEAFPNHVLIYTDDSLDHTKDSVTAAAIIRALGYGRKGHLLFNITSTTAELATIQLALEYLLSLQTLRKAVSLTDSRGVLLQLLRKGEANCLGGEIAYLRNQAKIVGWVLL